MAVFSSMKESTPTKLMETSWLEIQSQGGLGAKFI
jgi:hypothetical protein